MTDQDISGQARLEERQQRLDLALANGAIPYRSPNIFEQANPIVRSCVFRANNRREYFQEWTPIFTIGNDSISFKGPVLNTEHELLWSKLLCLARGISLTKPIKTNQANLMREMRMNTGGKGYSKLRRMLEDLEQAKVRISSRPALERLVRIMTSPDIADKPDGKFLKEFIKNRLGDHLDAISKSLSTNEPYEISLSFIQNRSTQPKNRFELINLDPMTCLFFDGINTTQVHYDVWDQLDPFGKKLVGLLKSHKGSLNLRLEKLYMASGYSTLEFTDSAVRKFKAFCLRNFKSLEDASIIKPGWRIERSSVDDEWVVYNIEVGEIVRKNEPLIEVLVATNPEALDYEDADDEAEDTPPENGTLDL